MSPPHQPSPSHRPFFFRPSTIRTAPAAAAFLRTARPASAAGAAPRAMATTTLFATAAVAAGAYAFYVRRSAAQAESPDHQQQQQQQQQQPPRPPFASFGFKSLRLQSTEKVNHDTKRLVFELPDPAAKSGLRLTSALLTISFPNGSWLPTVRPYTPVNDLNDKGQIEFLVKHYPNGKQSTHLHSLQPGDTLTFAPIPGYSWTPNEQPHIALVAGGQGITPCYQLLRGILTDPADRTRVTLVWGVNAPRDILLGDELARLQADHPGRLQVLYVVSGGDGSGAVAEAKVGEGHARGHVTRELLEKLGVHKEGGQVGKVFVCGPPGMEKALTGSKGFFGSGGGGILGELGYTKKDIHRF